MRIRWPAKARTWRFARAMQIVIASTVTELKAKGVKATGASVDITDGAALKSWISGVAQELGSVDMRSAMPAPWPKAATPLMGTEFPARRAWRRQRPSRRASVPRSKRREERRCQLIIISSISAAIADNTSSYGPIKQPWSTWPRASRRQYAAKKIRVNVVSPGTVYFKGGVWHLREQNSRMLSGCPLPQSDRPHGDSAGYRQCVRVSREPASSFTTGSNLIVDGAISNRVNF